MPPVHILIKPASGNCNLRCKYCFYADVIDNREVKSFGMMSIETLEAVVKKTLAYSTKECTIAFQGGEPTMIGLDFYRKLMEFEKNHNVKNLKINNAIQTNGYIIDEEWAKFFHDNNFLVGLSLDGIKDVNDLYRLNAEGKGTYSRVMKTIQLFDKHKVEYNILTVITAQTSKSIGKIYGFYKRNNLKYQQYIPCLEPFGEERGNYSYSLTPEKYTYFLKTLFDLWYNDVSKGEFAYNRYFENLAGMLKGYPPESCGLSGHCSNQYVVEADGGVYPCDFYVMDEFKIGSFLTDDFQIFEENRKNIGFVEKSFEKNPACYECKWKNLCGGGCRRDREPLVDGHLSQNYYCSSYQEFFEYAIPRLSTLINIAV